MAVLIRILAKRVFGSQFSYKYRMVAVLCLWYKH